MRTRIDLRGRHFLTFADYTGEELEYLLDLAAELKDDKQRRREHRRLNIASPAEPQQRHN